MPSSVIAIVSTGLAFFALYLWIFEMRKNQKLAIRLSALSKEVELVERKEKDQERLIDTFKALSSDALKDASHSFLELAHSKFEKIQENARGELLYRQKSFDSLILPIKESLQQVDKRITELDKNYHASQYNLVEQLKGVGKLCAELNAQTGKLSLALKAPHVRGRWGEIQLKRVVELAGMIPYCDFYEQESQTQSEKKLRPDLIVRLPNQRQIVVDAKTPIHAFLDAIEATDENIRSTRYKDHARHVRTHVSQLSGKAYWEQFSPAPEFVVLFIPGEAFFSAALEQDPSLIEWGVEQKVILATPTTLIALLRSVAYGWRQEALAENSRDVVRLGRELFSRLSKMNEHFDGIRKGLEGAVDGFNKAVGTFESRVMVSARKFKELEVVGDEELEPMKKVEGVPRN